MAKITTVYLYIILHIDFTVSSNVYHENSYVEFSPAGASPGDYFGYSTVLSPDRLFVGAPKAGKKPKFRFSKAYTEMTGSVFICPVKNLNIKQTKCISLLDKHDISDKLQPGGWFGASLALLPFTLMVSSPRQNPTIRYPGQLLQLQGACHFIRKNSLKHLKMYPLADGGRTEHQSFRLDGKRPEYIHDNIERVYYYALGQVGFSAAATKTNGLVLGAPGLLQFTGGVVAYNLDIQNLTQKISSQPIANTYFTMDITTDDYFGYSVESGVFERNGSMLYIGGAPRANMAKGKVLIFAPPIAENESLDIRAKLSGPQVGSYFGASLCSIDINADGIDDLLVGAPTFVINEDGTFYDQGAVFVYMTKESSIGFVLQEHGYVTGSGANAARFGNAIADLGDIDGDGFRDVGIGAPWEDDGVGAVYIYLGKVEGLKSKYIQRIQPPGARAFGWSIAKGLDLDKNNCNELAVGAFMSSTTYLYRCIPTMVLRASIKGPSIVNLQNNATTFTAMFCVSAPPIKFNVDTIQLNFTRKIYVDPVYNRAKIIDDSKHTYITTSPDNEICYEKTIHVNVTADLLKPIVIVFEIEVMELMTDESTSFLPNAARLSTDSIISTSLPIQLMRDCGDDLICKPWLIMKLIALNDPYMPGTKQKFGIKLSIWNEEEPAYGLKALISLPMYPKRIPRQCYVQNLAMTCDLPQPFLKNDIIFWELEMEYNANATKNKRFIITAEIIDKFGRQNISNDSVKKVILEVSPTANFSAIGKSMPNASITVFRDSLSSNKGITFTHYFEIRNHGPSDWPALSATIRIPNETIFIDPAGVKCIPVGLEYNCLWSIKANTSYPVSILLQTNVTQKGNIFTGEQIHNFTTHLYTLLSRTRYVTKFTSYKVTTTLILNPPTVIWYIVGVCIILGLMLLAIITKLLHNCGFFSRMKYRQREQIYQLLPDTSQTSDADTSRISDADTSRISDADTSRISDVDTSLSSKYDYKTENEELEENHNIILSLNMNTVCYHTDSSPEQSSL